MPSILVDSGADLLIYGAGENPFFDILNLLKKGVPIEKITQVRGTMYKTNISNESELIDKNFVKLPSFEKVISDKVAEIITIYIVVI